LGAGAQHFGAGSQQQSSWSFLKQSNSPASAELALSAQTNMAAVNDIHFIRSISSKTCFRVEREELQAVPLSRTGRHCEEVDPHADKLGNTVGLFGIENIDK
jgi:hypothetical protein